MEMLKRKTPDQLEIEAVREAGFSRYDKTLHSKCKKPELYGIQRIEAAEKAIAGTSSENPEKHHRTDNRKFKHKITARFPKGEYTLLQKAFSQSTDKTMQDYVRHVLIGHAKESLKNENRPDAGTSKAETNKTNNNITDKGEVVK